VPRWDKPKERDHQAVAIADRVSHFNGSTGTICRRRTTTSRHRPLACAMLPPSGPANTRCSVCRFEPGGLPVQLSPAPGTGLQSPETGSQNRRYRDLSRRQRLQVSNLNPRKCPQIAGYLAETRKSRLASNCVMGLRSH
jgi:hypothetical protein